MQFNLKFMREFFKFFRTSEGAAVKPQSDVMDLKEVGEVNVVTPKGAETFTLAVTGDDHNTQNTAWIVKTVDGKFIIVFHIDHFIKQISSENLNALYAATAHEVGHFLCGHFEHKTSANVDVRPEVQEFFFKRYTADQTEANEIAYMRSVFFALLKGGVVTQELEADLMALRFVPVADIIHIHTQDFDDRVNVFTVVEKVNRIKRLNQYVETNDIDREGYSLFIQLYDIKDDK